MPLYGTTSSANLRHSLRNFIASGGSSSYVGPAANNTVLPVGTITSGQASQLTIHRTKNSGGISDLKVGLARGRFSAVSPAGNKLIANPNSYTVNEISVRLVSGGTPIKLTKGGATSWTVTPWNGTNSDPCVDWSDLTALGTTIPADTDFYLFVSITGANLPNLSSTGAAVIAADELLQTSAGAPTTFTTTMSQSDANRRTRLAAVVGIEATRTGSSVAIIGDSLTAYVSGNIPTIDGSFSDHNRGLIPNMIGSAYNYVNLGIGGDQWETRLYDCKMQAELYARATHVVLALGVNSFHNKNEPNATIPLTLLKRYLPALNGKKVLLAEITPETTGAWTLTDLSDQNYASLGGVSTSTSHPAYNSGLAAIGPPVLAIRSAFAATGDANKFYADGTSNWSTNDGLHPKQQAVLRATASYGATAQSLIASAPTMTGATQPVATLTGATISGGKMTNGTGVNSDFGPVGVWTIIVKVTLPASIASAHNLVPTSTTNNGLKQVSISTAGVVSVTNAAPASISLTTPLTFGAENELMFACDGTNIYCFVNGTFDSSLGSGLNGSGGNTFRIAADSTKSISVRELTIWNTCLQTSGTYSVTTYTGTEAGLVGRFPLSTDANAIFGPVVAQ